MFHLITATNKVGYTVVIKYLLTVVNGIASAIEPHTKLICLIWALPTLYLPSYYILLVELAKVKEQI